MQSKPYIVGQDGMNCYIVIPGIPDDFQLSEKIVEFFANKNMTVQRVNGEKDFRFSPLKGSWDKGIAEWQLVSIVQVLLRMYWEQQK